jgi:hypothetical protein
MMPGSGRALTRRSPDRRIAQVGGVRDAHRAVQRSARKPQQNLAKQAELWRPSLRLRQNSPRRRSRSAGHSGLLRFRGRQLRGPDVGVTASVHRPTVLFLFSPPQQQSCGVLDLKACTTRKAPIGALVVDHRSRTDLATRKATSRRTNGLQQPGGRHGTTGQTGPTDRGVPVHLRTDRRYQTPSPARRQRPVRVTRTERLRLSGLTREPGRRSAIYLQYARNPLCPMSTTNLRVGDLVFYYSDAPRRHLRR